MNMLDVNQVYITFEDKIKVSRAFSNRTNKQSIFKIKYNTYDLSREIAHVGFSTTDLGGRIEEVEMLGK